MSGFPFAGDLNSEIQTETFIFTLLRQKLIPKVSSRMQSSVTVCGLLSFIVSVHAHVVETNFKECKSFFYKGFVPTGLDFGNQVRICQSYEENNASSYYFATLYNTGLRIPVYSAYKFDNTKGGHPDSPWCVEPQLVNENWDKNMMTVEMLERKYPGQIDMSKIEERQAVDQDYNGCKNLGYNRGHLNPRGHNVGRGSKATYTLTNAVPQNAELNSGAWAQYETNLKNIFKDCDETFVLVGAIPSSDNWIERGNVNRVNIPDYLWRAYCCVKKNKPVKTGAATAKNTDENKVYEVSLYDLKKFLKDKLKKKKVPELFDKTCQSSKATKRVVF